MKPNYYALLRDVQQDPAYCFCDRCGGEIYEARDGDAFGAVLCEECVAELADALMWPVEAYHV